MRHKKKARGYPSLERIWLCFGKEEEDDGDGERVENGDIVFGWARRRWRYATPAVTKKHAYHALEREGEGAMIFGE